MIEFCGAPFTSSWYGMKFTDQACFALARRFACAPVDEVNIGRVAALRMGCGEKVPGWTVMRNCASGMQSLDSAIANIQCGRSHLVLAGGVDALSHAPLLYSDTMVRWFAGMMSMRTAGQKLGHFTKLRPAPLLSPVIGLMKGLTDPVVGLLMGQTAENVVLAEGVTREEMDEWGARSQQRAVAAQERGFFDREITPVTLSDGTVVSKDDGPRAGTTVEKLAELMATFQKSNS